MKTKEYECPTCNGRGISGKHHIAFPVETNGPAHIIMTLDIAKAMNVPPNLEHIHRYAEETRQYLLEISRGNLPKWHELALPATSEYDTLQFFRRLHATNDGDVDKTLAEIARIVNNY